jgi:hypothetical protein
MSYLADSTARAEVGQMLAAGYMVFGEFTENLSPWR